MRLLRFLLWVLLVLALLLGLVLITDHAYLIRGVKATYFHGTHTASIDDAQFYSQRTVKATRPEEWGISNNYNKSDISKSLRDKLEENGTVAFLVIKDDQLLFEEYWDGYSDSSRSNSFSMAKSITTLLVQRAIQDGYIKSWEDRAAKYLPELQGPYRQDLKLRHLSMMTAGLDWDEHYSNPFGITARINYGDHIKETMFERVGVIHEPGMQFEYQSGSPQLLGFVISRATGMTVSEYASKTLWSDLGAQQDATWHLDDEDGDELAYCCFNSNARDFARFGKLLINDGKWNDAEVIDSTFVFKATRAGGVDHYGWSFWIVQDHPEHIYYLNGHLGQYVIVIPSKDLVVVRLGKSAEAADNNHRADLRAIVEEVLKDF